MKNSRSYKQILMSHKKFLEDEIKLEMDWLFNENDEGDNICIRHMHKLGIYQKILIRLLTELIK
jgi:hypothetical protein